MANSYRTISGETWDQIAYKAYGDEHGCDRIMDANRDKLEYFVFPEGVELVIPDMEIITRAVISDSPFWRSVLDG